MGILGPSLGAKAIVSPFVKTTSTLSYRRRNGFNFFGAHWKRHVGIAEVAIGFLVKSILKNFSLDLFPLLAVDGSVVIDAHRHLASLFVLSRRQRRQGKCANDENKPHGRTGANQRTLMMIKKNYQRIRRGIFSLMRVYVSQLSLRRFL